MAMTLNLNDSDNIKDYLLDIDDLGKPKVVDMSKIESGVFNPAILTIIRLIIMRKGTDPDRPDMGIDIVGRYRFSFESELEMLQQEITDQIERYLPEFIPVNVQVSFVQEQLTDKFVNKIQIAILIQGTLYQIVYDVNSSELEL